MRHYIILLPSLFVITLLGCSKSNTLPPSKDWVTFQSPDAPYSVSMPFKPKLQSQQADGFVLNMHMCEIGQELAVMTCANDFPEQIDIKDRKACNFILDESMKGALTNMKGMLKEQKTIYLNNKYPTREFMGTFKDPRAGAGTVRARIILTDNKLIQVMAVGKDEQIKKTEVTKFLESVKVK